jgi:hypothetical protein
VAAKSIRLCHQWNSQPSIKENSVTAAVFAASNIRKCRSKRKAQPGTVRYRRDSFSVWQFPHFATPSHGCTGMSPEFEMLTVIEPGRRSNDCNILASASTLYSGQPLTIKALNAIDSTHGSLPISPTGFEAVAFWRSALHIGETGASVAHASLSKEIRERQRSTVVDTRAQRR